MYQCVQCKKKKDEEKDGVCYVCLPFLGYSEPICSKECHQKFISNGVDFYTDKTNEFRKQKFELKYEPI